MNVFQKCFTLFICLSTSIGFSQEQKKDTLNTKIPISIYTASQISTNFNSLYYINNRLNLKSYQFLILDEKSIEMGNFTVPLYNISLAPSSYINDSYNKIYHKKNLESAFFKVSDLYLPRSKNPL